MLNRFPLLASLLVVVLAACGGTGPGVPLSYSSIPSSVFGGDTRRGKTADPIVEYGQAVQVGNGLARTYVVLDATTDSPIELGVAMTEEAMEGLPKPNEHARHMAAASAHEHLDNHVYLLSLPARGVAPYQFVELDWNPGGHEPPGIYDKPHFDFHFYTISQEDRASIVPTDTNFQRKADMLPAESQRPPFYAMAALPGEPAPGVPLMGVHWIDVRSPELQKMMGKPEAYKPFTTTFIYGSWAGRFTFLEPMITREHIMYRKTSVDPSVRNEIIPIPTAGAYDTAGYYPGAYRIAWDAGAKEYRVALTQMAMRK